MFFSLGCLLCHLVFWAVILLRTTTSILDIQNMIIALPMIFREQIWYWVVQEKKIRGVKIHRFCCCMCTDSAKRLLSTSCLFVFPATHLKLCKKKQQAQVEEVIFRPETRH